MRISEPFKAGVGSTQLPDLWSMFHALKDVPSLVVRGQTSDILSADTYKAMLARNRNARGVVIPKTGHAPTLEEPKAVKAIDELLARVMG